MSCSSSKGKSAALYCKLLHDASHDVRARARQDARARVLLLRTVPRGSRVGNCRKSRTDQVLDARKKRANWARHVYVIGLRTTVRQMFGTSAMANPLLILMPIGSGPEEVALACLPQRVGRLVSWPPHRIINPTQRSNITRTCSTWPVHTSGPATL